MTENTTGELLYGFEEIGKYLNISERQAKHLAEIEGTTIPIFNLGRRRCALKSRLDAWLVERAARAVEGDAVD